MKTMTAVGLASASRKNDRNLVIWLISVKDGSLALKGLLAEKYPVPYKRERGLLYIVGQCGYSSVIGW